MEQFKNIYYVSRNAQYKDVDRIKIDKEASRLYAELLLCV